VSETKKANYGCLCSGNAAGCSQDGAVVQGARYPEQVRLVISRAASAGMLDQVLAVFRRRIHGQLMQDRQTLSDLTAGSPSGMLPVLEAEKPDLVIAGRYDDDSLPALPPAHVKARNFPVMWAGLQTDGKFDPSRKR